jgi:hypothetical protein
MLVAWKSLRRISMRAGFDRAGFETGFNKAVVRLQRSEKITRETLRVLSRTVLEALHATEDIGYVNRLIEVLTPVNRKVAVKYFEHFGGFHFDDAMKRFTKKSGKRYDECEKLATAFLEDPLNNLWSWAERNIEIQKKDFSLQQVTESMMGYMKKAKKANISQVDVLKAVLAAGVEAESIIAMLDTLAMEPEAVVAKVADHFGFDTQEEGAQQQ